MWFWPFPFCCESLFFAGSIRHLIAVNNTNSVTKWLQAKGKIPMAPSVHFKNTLRRVAEVFERVFVLRGIFIKGGGVIKYERQRAFPPRIF